MPVSAIDSIRTEPSVGLPPEDAHVLLAGQSNALGFLNDGPAPYIPTMRVQVWADTNGDGQGDAWAPMLPGINTGTLANPHVWGSEVEVANRWLAMNPNGSSVLWIDKDDLVKGSTGLAEDAMQLDWSPHSQGEMFDRATASANAAMHSLDGTPHAFDHWDVLMWGQGETDATDPAKAAAYGPNVREFITDARAAWHVDEVVVMRITDTAGPYSLPVRQAQWNLDNGDDPMPGVHTFKTIGIAMRPDGIHYADHITLGGDFFDGWLLP